MDPTTNYLKKVATTRRVDTKYFADLGGAPGAWAEYILWRTRGAGVKGIGMSLRTGLQYALERSNLNIDSSLISLTYGNDKTGDILNPDNIKHFVRYVQKETEGQGMQLGLGDIGTDVEGKDELQEQIHTTLILAEILTLLQVLAKGANLVVKIYETYSGFMVDVLEICIRHFETACIFKPISSRSGNSERYLVCKRYYELWLSQPSLDKVYLVLTLRGTKTSKILKTNDDSILSYIMSMNDYHAQMQASSLEYFLYCDQTYAATKGVLTRHSKTNPPPDYIYDMNLIIELWDLPQRGHDLYHVTAYNIFTPLYTTLEEELSLFGYVSDLLNSF